MTIQTRYIATGAGIQRVVRGVSEIQRAVPQGDLVAQGQLGIDVPTTALVVGQPRLSTFLGEQLFRPVGVPNVAFLWRKYGKEAFRPRETRRPFRSLIQYTDRRVDSESARLERHTWATMIDQDELQISEAFDATMGLTPLTRSLYQGDSRLIVDTSLEQERSVIALAAASYSQAAPDLDVTLASGSEFNDATNGDSRTVVRSLAQTLAAANGVSLQQIDAFASFDAFHAAQDDPKFITRRSNNRTDVAGADELASYWGINSLVVGDAYVSTDGTTVTSLYGDALILRINANLAGFDTREGQLDSFVRFGPQNANLGQALQAWFDNDHTSWKFPWETWTLPRVISTTTAAIIRNTKA